MDSAGGVMLPEGPASDQHAVNSGILSTEANKLRRDCSSILECTSAANLHATANPHRVPLMRRLVQQDSKGSRHAAKPQNSEVGLQQTADADAAHQLGVKARSADLQTGLSLGQAW